MPHSCVWGLLCLSACAMSAQPQTPAAVRADKAASAMRAGHFEEAAQLYGDLCEQFPAEASLHLSLAAALHSAGHYPEALRELQGIQSGQTQNPKYWLLLGLTEANLEQPAEAIAPFMRAVQLDPADNEARLEAASTLLQVHRFYEAAKQFQILSSKLPSSPKPWQGLTLAETGLSQQALDELKKSAPRSSYLYGLAALAASEAGEMAHAAELYRKALAAPPELPWLPAELSAVESGAARTTCPGSSDACRVSRGEIANVADRVASLHDPEALYWTVRLSAQLARDSMRALSSLPPTPEQHQVMARLYAQNGRRSEAIAELREAVKLSPANSLVSADLAEALWADRQYEECLQLLAPLLASRPGRADWQFEAGDSLFNLGRSEEALTHLAVAVERSPGLLPAQAKFGEALLRTGNAAAALPHLELAQSIDRDGSLHFQLAAAYRKLGNQEAASKALQRQQELADQSKANSARLPATQ